MLSTLCLATLAAIKMVIYVSLPVQYEFIQVCKTYKVLTSSASGQRQQIESNLFVISGHRPNLPFIGIYFDNCLGGLVVGLLGRQFFFFKGHIFWDNDQILDMLKENFNIFED